jgi:hypothetical protein
MALTALVAGAVTVVYAWRGGAPSPDPAEARSHHVSRHERASKQPPKPETEVSKPVAGSPAAAGPSPVFYDLSALPEPVKHTLEDIIVAAQSGDIEKMRPVLESNELKPLVATPSPDDPIAFWKKMSADGNGRDVLAAMLNVFSSGFVRVGEGKEEMYVWPYFAQTDLAKLSSSQEVELYRVVPAAQAVPMKSNGKYTYYQAGIAADGVWHYFLQ